MKQNTLFKVPKRPGKDDDKAMAQNAKSRKQSSPAVKGGGNTLSSKVAMARQLSEKLLGHLKDSSTTIQDEQTLIEYIDVAIKNKVIAIDTETNGLDRISGKIAGICIYTPNMKPAYIPIGHISCMTHMLLPNQLDKQFVKGQLQRLLDNNVKLIYHNAKFDLHVLYWMMDILLPPYWDTYIASNLLNENEEHNLKVLYNKYCQQEEETAHVAKFNTLFKGIEFNMIPLDIAYLYASHDALMTYELYKFQEQYLDPSSPLCEQRGLTKVAEVFRTIEMPLIQVVFEMERTGINIDLPYAESLHEKYSKELSEALEVAEKEIAKVQDDIDKLSVEKPNLYKKLDRPINIGSPTQLAILLYDVLKFDSGDTKSPRGTGEEILKNIGHPICDAILKYRTVSKLMSTYIDAIPAQVNSRTGKLHATFKQYGAKTGRFSSASPNLQNIPSHNKDIRKMFIPPKGYLLVGADYS